MIHVVQQGDGVLQVSHVARQMGIDECTGR
jgi:hypothetical protein